MILSIGGVDVAGLGKGGVQYVIYKFYFYHIGITDEKDFPRINEIFHRCYDPHIKIFPWVEKMLGELSSEFVVTVLSNSITSSLQKTFKDMDQCIDMIIGSDIMPELKPHPGGIQMIVDRYSADVENVWMIGDSQVDILTGQNAGAKTIAVAWGATESVSHLYEMGANKVFFHPADLFDFLRNQG
jgi:phosphoglycolate phosphatase